MTDISKEAVNRLIDREPILTSMPPQETDVAKTLRALSDRIEQLEAALATASSMAFWRPIVEEQSCGEWTPEIIKTDASTMARAVAALINKEQKP